MELISKKVLATVALVLITGTAAAADYDNWGVIDPYGLQMTDQWGGIHYTNPYAYDSQVDVHGNVIYSGSGMLDPSPDYFDLIPVQPHDNFGSGDAPSNSTYVPYSNPVDSHQSFINSIWE